MAEAVLILGQVVICCSAHILILFFFKFHLELVLSNKTTIENLDKKRQEESGQAREEQNIYDMGQYYNWVQVFGTKKLLWFVPLETEMGKEEWRVCVRAAGGGRDPVAEEARGGAEERVPERADRAAAERERAAAGDEGFLA